MPKCFDCGQEDPQDSFIDTFGYCESCFDKHLLMYEAEQTFTPSAKHEAAAAVIIGLIITILGLFIGSLF